MSEVEIPSQFELMWPLLEALKQLGGSAHNDEIAEEVIETEGFTEEQQEVRRRPADPMSRIEYHLAWARNGLKNVGAIENSARGVWAITELGRSLDEREMHERVRAWRTEYNRRYQEQRRQAAEAAETLAPVEDALEEPGRGWRDVLIGRLLEMPPRCLRASGAEALA